MSPSASAEALRGTLDLLILKTLSLTPMHGWGISQRIQKLSKGLLEVNQGSLYPALVRLEQKGLIDTEWKTTEHGRSAKYYHLTKSGQRGLGAEESSWRRHVDAVDLILRTS